METNHGGRSGGAHLADHEQEEFLLREPAEIVGVLNQLARRPEIVTAYFDAGRRHLITAVLAADVRREELLLDVGPDERINRLALDADRLVCIAKHQRVSIKFACGPLARLEHDGRPAFHSPLPDSLYRLQRREYFRVTTPVAMPVCCRIPDPGESSRGHVFRAVDLSAGGVGLLDYKMALRLEPRDRIPGAELQIPDAGAFPVDLEVRNISRHVHQDGQEGRRIGMAFLHLSPEHAGVVQRYLHRLQVLQRDTRPDD